MSGFLRSLFARGGRGPSIVVPRRRNRIVELDDNDKGAFATMAQETERLSGRPLYVEVAFEITFDPPAPPPRIDDLGALRVKMPGYRRWFEAGVFSRERWQPGGARLPDPAELEAIRAQYGAVGARTVERFTT